MTPLVKSVSEPDAEGMVTAVVEYTTGVDLWKPLEAQAFPWEGRERCGFVVRTGVYDSMKDNPFEYFPADVLFVEVPNVSSMPHIFFEMSAEAVRSVRSTRGWTIVGIWHTHPSGRPEPSSTDWEWMPKQWPFFIICDGQIYMYEFKEGSGT